MPRKINKSPQAAAHESPLLDVEQSAEYLKIKVHTLDVWRCTGRYAIPFVKIGGRVCYRKADLDAWIESRVCGVVE